MRDKQQLYMYLGHELGLPTYLHTYLLIIYLQVNFWGVDTPG